MSGPGAGVDDFPGLPPKRWHELSDEQRDWFSARFPWFVDGRTPQHTPREVIELVWRGFRLGMKRRARIPVGARPDAELTALALRLADMRTNRRPS